MIYIQLLCAITSSVLYRAGGLSKDQSYWIPKWMRRTWVRDWLCPLYCLLPLFIENPSWWFIPTYGLMGAAFTTYWDKLFKYDNFWFSGFMLGIAQMPLAFAGFEWGAILLRAVMIGIFWGAWCSVNSNDHVEEHGRGFIVAIMAFIR